MTATVTVSALTLVLFAAFAGNVEGKAEVSCGVNKVCVAPQYCSNGRINTLGATLIDVRFGFSECGGIEICCQKDNVTSTPNLSPMDTAPCCGHRNANGVGIKVIEATTETDFGEFPWMLAILRKLQLSSETAYVYQCGGSLIHPRIALTAAHRAISGPAGDFLVRAGEWEPHSESEPFPHEDRKVKEVIVHSKHNNSTQIYDAALLILESPFVLKPHINTICLPTLGRDSSFNRCFTTGWGKLEFGKNRYPKLLKKIIVMVLPKVLCHYDLRKTRLGQYFELHDSFICAEGQDNTDACTGDGGSPLVCPMEGSLDVATRYYQAGLVTWGIGCGQKMIPGVYVNVAFIRTWIEEQLAQRGIQLMCQ